MEAGDAAKSSPVHRTVSSAAASPVPAQVWRDPKGSRNPEETAFRKGVGASMHGSVTSFYFYHLGTSG